MNTVIIHEAGHAIDMNLFYEGEIYNSKRLLKSNHINLPDNIPKFFDLIRSDMALRWGGDFGTEDPVHIDNDFYRKREIFYLAKLDSRISQANA